MLAEMTAEDYWGWKEYFSIHGGLGPQNEWEWRGLLVSTIVNSAPFRNEKAEAVTPEKIYPWLKALTPPAPEPTTKQAARQSRRMMWALKVQVWKERTALQPNLPPPRDSG